MWIKMIIILIIIPLIWCLVFRRQNTQIDGTISFIFYGLLLSMLYLRRNLFNRVVTYLSVNFLKTHFNNLKKIN